MILHNSQKNSKTKTATLFVVRVAFMASLLTALKFALSFVPNVEVVTLLILVYGACFGFAYSVSATLIFCAVEVAIYGVGSWVLLYFIYWPMLAVFASLFLRGGRMWLALIFAGVGSVLFGVLSACADTLFCVANLASNQIGRYWIAYYLRGLTFDGIHVVSNIIVILVLYNPLVAVCRRISPKTYYGRRVNKKMLNMQDTYTRE